MAEKKLVSSLDQVGTNIRELAKEKFAGLKSVFSLPGDVYKGKRPPSIQNAIKFGNLVNLGGGGGGGVANVGMLQKGLMKKMAKGLRTEGKDLPKRWKKAHMQGLRSIPNVAASRIDDLVVTDFGRNKVGVLAAMRETMEKKNIYRVNAGFKNPARETPRTLNRAIRESGVHEATHAVQKSEMMMLKDLPKEIEFNTMSALMYNSARRFQALNSSQRQHKYRNVVHEVHARAMAASEKRYRTLLKKGSNLSAKTVDNMFKQDFMTNVDIAMKSLKMDDRAEYNAIVTMTVRDMIKKYGSKAIPIIKKTINPDFKIIIPPK